ncbi:exopolysaccharide biosynthesis protein [Ectothiorhodospiraceae bacterium 2226]|nr:exopolysaccharide biosynthesis protein [Ectothiorhodospiraceae bacterium 2226]
MTASDEAKTLAEVVDEITGAGDGEGDISVAEILQSVGQRSFGPMLLVPGLIVLSPISGIPGVPTLGGIVVLLIAGQLLIGRQCFWVPQMIQRRAISRKRMKQAGRFLMAVARVVDKVVKPRLSFLVQAPFNYVIAATCVLIAVSMPPLEAIPFANVVTAAAISAFGLALVAYDGVLALIAFALTGVSFYFLFTGLLF